MWRLIMSLASMPFDRRLKRIVRNHRRMSHGVVHSVNSNGLIVARPRLYNPKFPLKGLLLAVVAMFAFKGFLYASLGAETFDLRVAELAAGSSVEKVGAWVMQADVGTTTIAEFWKQLGV